MPRRKQTESSYNPPGTMRVYAVNPAPMLPYGYRNPMSKTTLVVLALLGVAAVGGTIYFVSRKAKAAPPQPTPGPAPQVKQPRDLGVFSAPDLLALPDPVIFVLEPGDSFEVDLGTDNELIQLVYGQETKLGFSEPGMGRTRITATDAWTPQAYARLTLLGPTIDVFKTLWVTGTNAQTQAAA